MSDLLKEILDYLRELEDRQWREVERNDLSPADRQIYRERAQVLIDARAELERRYAP